MSADEAAWDGLRQRLRITALSVVDPCMKEKVDACCCTCSNHLDDYSHELTDGRSCTEPRGWICVGMAGMEGGGAHSGWSEHGMCEMWEPAP